MKKFISWITAGGERERAAKDAAEKLQMSMRTTAKCRYNASSRLQRQGKFSFFTTTVLSLGLVFIPLMQNAEVPLAFQANVLNMMQIFLGVAVLVYSVVIGTARYDMRAEQLTECGDKLKELIRSLDKDRELSNGSISGEKLATYQKHYSEIVTDVENHDRNDYRFATLEMVNDYFITGLPRLKLYTEAHLIRAFGFTLPIILMLMEVIFITDMMGATEILTPYLNGTAVKAKLTNHSSEVSSTSTEIIQYA
ncbi:SLATT domain-containing protein [Crenobacter intestini]|uniref:SLATT domain-containing protein n=1 Tax=Crenobacter intestini TaxID=2563443 RepID=A0A4T0UM93_9NEIS|nr:SLATT domain-containing protein [Crenobacter intestini]TIC79697.1 SLATT domain-containing protein [Crenobacter intestini]